ncbi:MAG TPA: isoleucine--tRNA ligase [Geminicoccus sp.]|jgi:isoleucyl-tRNA synthetase|uniref:isoleucine--tRNA ligase n=1 Tax=Geminicoccus sp. TaxID=2024832 RepID=UPI002E30BA57|nr:isoleucine--tRNA ligase [Geminicoccus sp.]HEX2526227.1 isoleucine--tRNA ligase [Geminicoccus sp.]
MSQDLKSTVFLPKTDFPMRAALPEREPAIVQRWIDAGLWEQIRGKSKGRPLFVLHDGPPYANGNIHMGTTLNKVLKDLINRSRQMLGYDANYVPGWDCHGLPIEWQIEQEYRKRGADKDAVPIVQFRQECRRHADKYIDIQRKEFQRLGCLGDWNHPYTTMAFSSEASIFEELAKFLQNGSLYRGLKAVMWSTVEKTALAEAEVEYHDHTSTTIWVRFPLARVIDPVLTGAAVVIWTTTPWTIPANRAVAYGSDIAYVALEPTEVADDATVKAGDRLIVAEDLLPSFLETARITTHKVRARFPGSALAGCIAHHPLRGLADGYMFDVPLLAGDFVTTEQGTGLVHIAPSHGEDDFNLGAENDIPAEDTVGDDGTYTARVPGFVGTHVFKAHEPVIAALAERGALVARGKLLHSYPHSWRSKAPLIFRATAQWFIAMDDSVQVRSKALAAIDATTFVPEKGKNRLRSMVEDRPDWCVSRQRAWGVPIAVFVDKATGQPLRDPEVCRRIADSFREEGSDAWWSRDPQSFLGDRYRAEDFEKVDDILDVWFDSGSTHAFTLEGRPDLRWPADLYLEGSDQHRGWFQSSLLESCGTRGRAPFDTVLTHGFVVDAAGRKMSKSLGNTLSPMDLMKTHGADILRLWVVSTDFSEDIRISKDILDRTADSYRKARNTLRYLLANLDGFSPAERLPYEQLPELEQWVLHRLAEIDRAVRDGNEAYDFLGPYKQVLEFASIDLSAFYFDVRKDSLYCDHPEDLRRRAARTVLDRVFEHLVRWLAPILVFTTEEAWRYRRGEEAGSIHLEQFLEIPASWMRPDLGERWDQVRTLRRVVTGALEIERREKRIGSSLEAAPEVYMTEAQARVLDGLDLAELAITSWAKAKVGEGPADAFRLEEVAGASVVPKQAEGEKCLRCWRVLPEVSNSEDHVCRRCAGVLGRLRVAA